MKKPIQISISTPCHENWDAMTPADKGRFCGSCQKTVIDFTNASDREIASVLKNTENACGRFRTAQLDRDLIVPKEKSSLWMAASAAVVSFLTIGNHTISAQAPVNTEQHSSENDEIVGKVAQPKRIVSGKIADFEGFPIPEATVINVSTGIKTTTDYDGLFSIEAIKGETLKISYVSMISQNIRIEDKTNLEVILIPEEIEGIAVGGISMRRTFFGRVFYSIGNIFR